VIAAEANPIGADQVRHMGGHDCSDGRHRKAFRHHHLVLGVHVGAISVAGTVSSPRMIGNTQSGILVVRAKKKRDKRAWSPSADALNRLRL